MRRHSGHGGSTGSGLQSRSGSHSSGLVVIASATMFTAPAWADAAKVTIPSGPFRDGQTIAVSGSGFPESRPGPHRVADHRVL